MLSAIVNNESKVNNSAVPEIEPVRAENIPTELQGNQWVAWGYKLKDGKPTKVPYTLAGSNASHSNPETWNTFKNVLTHAEERDGERGVGRAFSAYDPYCGVDFDNCLTESGEPKEWARPWIERLERVGAYIEVSPSGVGLKSIFRATLPEKPDGTTGRRKKIADGEIEVYDRTRFFTFTGKSITGTPNPIGVAQEVIDDLLQDLFKSTVESNTTAWEATGLTAEQALNKALNDKTGEKFRKLWDGDFSDYDDDESRAEFAIANKLNFYTGDPEVTEEIIRSNQQLFRDKWETHSTYLRERTIENALPDEFYTPTDGAGLLVNEDSTDSTDRYPSYPEFPLDAMPAATRRFIYETAAAVDVPVDLVGGPVLAALSAAIGNSLIAEIKPGYQEPALLYMVVVKEPGSGQTPAFKKVMEPIKAQQRRLKKEYEFERENYEDQLRQWAADKRLAVKNDQPEPRKPQQPVFRSTWADDTTIEKLAEMLVENPRGLLLLQDELIGWLNSFDQYKQGGKGDTRQKYLKIHSHETIKVDRKGNDVPLYVENPFVAICGGIQTDLFGNLLSEKNDGFIDRFLIVQSEPHVSWINDLDVSQAAAEEYKSLIDKLYEESYDPEAGPYSVKMSRAAWALYRHHNDQLSSEQASGVLSNDLKNAWSKLKTYLGRLSLIMAASRFMAEGSAWQIEEIDVQNAARLLDYFKSTVMNARGQLDGKDSVSKVALEILALLDSNEAQSVATPTEYVSLLPSLAGESPESASRLIEKAAKRTGRVNFRRKKRGNERVIKLTFSENTVRTVRSVDEGEPMNRGEPKIDINRNDSDSRMQNSDLGSPGFTVHPDVEREYRQTSSRPKVKMCYECGVRPEDHAGLCNPCSGIPEASAETDPPSSFFHECDSCGEEQEFSPDVFGEYQCIGCGGELPEYELPDYEV